MISLLQEVGRGKRGARDLTYEEALRVAEAIVTGEATAAQIGAFLMAERFKMETVDELLAFIHTLRSRSVTYPMEGSLDCAGPYDGRTRSFMATFPTAFVLAACGLPTTLHSGSSLPPKWGVTLVELLQALQVPIVGTSREALVSAAARTGFLFVPAEAWCKPLQKLRGLREELGLRTMFNTAEKLLRYTDSPYMAAGVFHGTVFEKMAGTMHSLGIRRGIVVQGMEGSEDVAVDRKTRTYIIDGGASDLLIIDPELLEMSVDTPETEWTAAMQAETALAVLKGQAELPYLNMVLLNSAVRLWISEKTGSIEEGIYLARHTLYQGAAWQKYKEWTHAVNPVSTL